MGFEKSVDWFGISVIRNLEYGILTNQIIGAIRCPKRAKKIKDCQYKAYIEMNDNSEKCLGRAINERKEMEEQSHVLALVCSPRPGKF